MDRLQAIQSFIAVVEAGSFVAAAEALGQSKAAVSRHVQELEAHLGTRLLHRTTRRLSLTPEGRLFHARGQGLLADLADAEAEVSARSAQAVGTVRVNAPVTFGHLHLAPLWADFEQRHPRVRLEVTLSDRMVDLVDEGFDLAIRIARLGASSLVSRPLSSTRMVLCASPAYLARHGEPTHPGELAGHTIWAYSGFSMGDEWPFDGPEGPVVATVHPTLRSNSGETCRIGALRGHAIVLQPSFLVGQDLLDGSLVELMPAYRSVRLGIHAVYPSRKHLPSKVRLLVDHLAAAFHTARWPD